MSIIEDLLNGQIALVDAIGKLEDARYLLNRFTSQAEPKSVEAGYVVHEAKMLHATFGTALEILEDINATYLEVLDAVDVADVLRRAHG